MQRLEIYDDCDFSKVALEVGGGKVASSQVIRVYIGDGSEWRAKLAARRGDF